MDDYKEILIKRVTLLSVIVAIIITIIKIFAVIATDSLSLLTALIDSVLDILSSVINMVAVRYAMVPADEDHRFGHGKAEPIASLGQAAFIAGSAVFIAFQAIVRFFHPQEIHQLDIGIGAMIISLTLTVGLVGYQRYVIAKTRSTVVKADHMHYASDVMMNLSIIISLILAKIYGWNYIDSILALLIAIYIFHGAWEISKESLDMLMDKEFADDEREKILEIAKSHPEVISIHDLRTRKSGNKSFMQMHVEMDANMSLAQAHKISDEIENALQIYFPYTEILIHQDPYGYD